MSQLLPAGKLNYVLGPRSYFNFFPSLLDSLVSRVSVYHSGIYTLLGDKMVSVTRPSIDDGYFKHSSTFLIKKSALRSCDIIYFIYSIT